MIEADRAEHSRAKLDHDLIVPITRWTFKKLSIVCNGIPVFTVLIDHHSSRFP